MSQPTEYTQVFDNCPDGGQFGNTSTQKIAFYGATPIARLGVSTAISTTAFISTSGIYGFATSTEGLQVSNAVSTLTYALVQLGLITAVS